MRRRLFSLGAVGLAAALAVTACTPAEPHDGGGGADLGWAGCEDNPDMCHTGPVDAGGEITVLISLPPGGWSVRRSSANSVYTVQAVEGIWPDNSTFLPSGDWRWDPDLYDGEP
jgi:peptide/nickel transport system substrate-binding protein